MAEAGQVSTDASSRPSRVPASVALVLSLVAYAALQLGSLGHPLFWQDEGETAMFGRRVLDYGYPKVHGREGVVYGMGVPLEAAVDPENDAYLGSLWGQYYFAALAVAWSDGARDDHARTGRVRLPFALAGLAGLAGLVLAVRRELAARSGTALPAMTGFFLLACLATSLQLHLREARYAGPVLLLVGLAFWLDRKQARADTRASAGPGWALTLALVLVLLLNFFYPAAVALMIWLAIEAGLATRRAGQDGPAMHRLLLRVVPVAIAAVVAIPLFLHFDVFTLSRLYSERWQFGADVYFANLGHLVRFLWRYELLGVTALAEILLVITRTSADRRLDPARRVATSLWRLIIVYGLVGARNPIFFERYFVVLGPLLMLVFVLDVEVLWARFERRDGRRPARAARRTVVAVLVTGLVLTLLVRRHELAGRVQEIVVPVAGPIDVVVADLRARHRDPAGLVIATNYEAEPLMFYLGSEVVGRFHSGRPEAIAAERAVRPDVVIPRTGHTRRLDEVRRYLLTGGFERRALAIGDTPYNTIPELYAGRVLDETHWSTTRLPGPTLPAVSVYERASE